MSLSQSSDAFTIERHGEVTLISASPALEELDSSFEEQAATLVMGPLRGESAPQVVFDLSEVRYFGSMFLGILLRCWKLINLKGGSMVLAGVSPQVKELLRLTSLDMMWPMYPDRREALAALLSE